MVAQFVQKLKIKEDRENIVKMINSFLLFVFLFNAIFFPADPFELKILSFGLLLLFNLKTIFTIKNRFDAIIIFIGFVVPSAAIFMSIVQTGEVIANLRQGYVGYILLLLPLIRNYNFDYKKAFMYIMLGLAAVTIYMGIMHVFSIINIYNNPLYALFTETDCAMIGVGPALLNIVVFMKASPIFVVCVAYSLYQRKFGQTIIYLIALIFSGTRANLLVGFAVFIIGMILMQNKQNLKRIMFAFLAILIILIIDGRIVNEITSLFSEKASGDDVRNGTLSSILTGWAYNPLSIICGTGFSSQFFNQGIGENSIIVELSYWNLLRQVGIINFIFIVSSFLYPAVKLLDNGIKERNIFKKLILVIGLLGYMIIAYTNPLLYSTTGYVMLLFMYLVIDEEMLKNEKRL